MKIVNKNGEPIKKKAAPSWEESIDHCIDNFDKEEAKKRIKNYIAGLDAMYRKRILQAAKASITQNTGEFEKELKKGMINNASKIMKG